MSEKKYTKDHEWIKIENEIGTVGITNNAQEQLGDILGPTFQALDEKLQQEVAKLVFSASGGPITKLQIESVVKFLEEAGVEISDALKAGTALLNANIAAYMGINISKTGSMTLVFEPAGSAGRAT